MLLFVQGLNDDADGRLRLFQHFTAPLMPAVVLSPSWPIEAERFDHRGINLRALLVLDQGETTAAAVDPSRPNEPVRFGLLAYVVNPGRAFGRGQPAAASPRS